MNTNDLKKLIKEMIQNEISFSPDKSPSVTVDGHLKKLFGELRGEEYTLGFGKGVDGWYLLTPEDQMILRKEFPQGNYKHKKVPNADNPNKPEEYFSLGDIMALYEYGFHIVLMHE